MVPSEKKVYIGEITDREGDIAFEDLKGLPVQFMPTAYLCDRAWEIASSSISDGYMTHFTSLLQKKGHVPFWTADMELYRAVKDKLVFVKSLEDYVSS